MDEDSDENPKDDAYRLPGDMLTAHLLALMKGWTGYGYELAKRLEESGIRGYNTGSLYRTLRQMEKHGLISSLWDTSESGPAKRMYTMTSGGTLFLRNWLKVVDMHKSMLEQFLDIENPASADEEVETPASGAGKRGKKAAARRPDAAGKPSQNSTQARPATAKTRAGTTRGKSTTAPATRRKKASKPSRDDSASDS